MLRRRYLPCVRVLIQSRNVIVGPVGRPTFFLCFFSFHYTSYLPASSTMSTCESAEDILLKANTEFLDKNFKSALEQYNLSIELDDKVSDAFVKRALCLEKLKRFAGITIIYFTIFYII